MVRFLRRNIINNCLCCRVLCASRLRVEYFGFVFQTFGINTFACDCVIACCNFNKHLTYVNDFVRCVGVHRRKVITISLYRHAPVTYRYSIKCGVKVTVRVVLNTCLLFCRQHCSPLIGEVIRFLRRNIIYYCFGSRVIRIIACTSNRCYFISCILYFLGSGVHYNTTDVYLYQYIIILGACHRRINCNTLKAKSFWVTISNRT